MSVLQASFIRAFISSTSHDLSTERSKACAAIMGMGSVKPIRMEDFGAQAAETAAYCAQVARESDVYIGILGHCAGTIAPGTEKSFTQLEYEAACESEKPTLVFLLADEAPARCDHPTSISQQEFRELARTRIACTFADADELATKVVLGIHNWYMRVSVLVSQEPEIEAYLRDMRDTLQLAMSGAAVLGVMLLFVALGAATGAILHRDQSVAWEALGLGALIGALVASTIVLRAWQLRADLDLTRFDGHQHNPG